MLSVVNEAGETHLRKAFIKRRRSVSPLVCPSWAAAYLPWKERWLQSSQDYSSFLCEVLGSIMQWIWEYSMHQRLPIYEVHFMWKLDFCREEDEYLVSVIDFASALLLNLPPYVFTYSLGKCGFSFHMVNFLITFISFSWNDDIDLSWTRIFPFYFEGLLTHKLKMTCVTFCVCTHTKPVLYAANMLKHRCDLYYMLSQLMDNLDFFSTEPFLTDEHN